MALPTYWAFWTFGYPGPEVEVEREPSSSARNGEVRGAFSRATAMPTADPLNW
jgi:hypothetical protein